jgi:serine phosphatase RsbU (regulator of sigma subunit)
LSFALGDVAGKGTSAALLTAVVQGLFAGEVELTGSPSLVLARVNKGLCRRSVAARFVTAFYGHIGHDGILRYCNAGHNPPFLISSTGVHRLETGGSVLGLFDFANFDTGEIPFKAGDLLAIFSDGVTEAENAAGEEFGDDRLEQCLATVRNSPATHAIQKAVRDFCGTVAARDDVTVMVLMAR